MLKKITISKEIQKKMLSFFFKTSIPKMISGEIEKR